jgi:hypothetical protein
MVSYPGGTTISCEPLGKYKHLSKTLFTQSKKQVNIKFAIEIFENRSARLHF